MLLAARARGLGATLTTFYLQFEEEAEAALGLPPGFHSYALLPIGYPVGRSGQSAVSLSPMWFTKIGGAHVIGIKNASLRLNAAALGLWRATKLSIRALF
jgi:hypothetical protein